MWLKADYMPNLKELVKTQFNADSSLNQMKPGYTNQRSLHMPQSAAIAKDLFDQNNVIIFGETHDPVNYKFLADNPEYFKEAAAHQGKYLFLENPVDYAPIFKEYFDGNLDEKDLEHAIKDHNKEYNLGNKDDYARETVAMCKVAKDNGIIVLPSDFARMGNKNLLATSDLYGIPDIQERKDSVHDQTLKSLAEFTKQSGKPHPISKQDQDLFGSIHLDRIQDMSDIERAIFFKDLDARQAEWQRYDNIPGQENKQQYRDELQFNYYQRTVKPGDVSMFVVGSNHFTKADSIDNFVRNNGYGKTIGVNLLSDKVLDYRREHASDQPSSPLSQSRPGDDQFAYTIHTEQGIAFDSNGEKVQVPGPSIPKHSSLETISP